MFFRQSQSLLSPPPELFHQHPFQRVEGFGYVIGFAFEEFALAVVDVTKSKAEGSFKDFGEGDGGGTFAGGIVNATQQREGGK